ncbi:DUF7344 domain-containing protein [Natrarchaeobaculum aegyptiacum]|uniref:DUF7344 domain-containing protein n=1 Tax=Natrarchaeobaculum aegyptiacum TaxID=745377 RepID=A0A2Z2HUG0_9EURY|nr:hypothetical protein [Natrarchaeobaculum aegyptiacum]ARS90413.1 hypothetical protein B1756_12190 [Natrarchaeobaculum aegyptiacum]
MVSSNPDPLSRDAAYAICANPCRRRLLEQLTPGERRTVGSLARDLARTAADSSDGSGVAVDEYHLESQLVHNHLPFLHDHDVIDYRPAENVIVVPEEVGDRFPSVLAARLNLNTGSGDGHSRGDGPPSSS